MCNLFPLQARSHGDAEAASAKPVPTPARSDQAPPAAPAAPAECMAAKVEPEAGYALFLELFANNIYQKIKDTFLRAAFKSKMIYLT